MCTLEDILKNFTFNFSISNTKKWRKKAFIYEAKHFGIVSNTVKFAVINKCCGHFPNTQKYGTSKLFIYYTKF